LQSLQSNYVFQIVADLSDDNDIAMYNARQASFAIKALCRTQIVFVDAKF